MADTHGLVRRRFEESVAVKQQLLDDAYVRFTGEFATLLIATYQAGGRLLLCGNGGSAADAMHLASELVGRYLFDRPPLSAISLADTQSAVTCIANDYDFDEVFARGVRAHGRAGDVLLAISTSGTSPNVIAAVEAARDLDMRVVGFTGAKGEQLDELSDLCLRVPSEETPRIQEAYMLVGHTVCELVEAALYS